MALIGLDIGTTGCKAFVFDASGKILGGSFQEYGIVCQEPGMAEQDAEGVWRTTCGVLSQALAESRNRSGVSSEAIEALSVSVQGDAVIPVDRRGNAIYNAILGMDYRSTEQAERCGELFGARALFDRTGMRPHPIDSIVKILWIKETLPDVYRETWKIMTYADYIMSKLGAEPVIDYTMASRTMAFELKTLEWSSWILEGLEIEACLLSDPRPSGQIVGKVGRAASDETGLTEGTLLVTGGHDQACAGLGAGLIREGRGVVSTGTAEVLSSAFDKPALNDPMYEGFYPCYLHAKSGMYFTFSLNHVGGILLQWYRDNFGSPELREAEATGASFYKIMDGKVPDGPSHVMVLPHLNGSGTPWCDMKSKGAIIGLDLSTTRHDLVRAILESQTYELKINLEKLESAGVVIGDLCAVGGGAKSPLWLQIKADILGRPVRTLKTTEAACLGAAILAGAAAGTFASVEDGVQRCVEHQAVYLPDERRKELYNEKYAVYKGIYPALSPINQKLEELKPGAHG
jgi:xylulokinase